MKTGDNMKEHPQRLELRERIIDTALNSFATHGIKSITMDDIAAALGISKRTLYEVFSDKETLLMECLLKAQREGDAYVKDVYEKASNVLEVLLKLYQRSIEKFHNTNKKFFEDIKKYPKVYAELMKRRNRDSEETIAFFKLGIQQGYFRDDVNFTIVNLLVREQLDLLMNTDLCKEHSFLEVYESIMFTYLRGISTEKGARKLEEFIREYRKSRFIFMDRQLFLASKKIMLTVVLLLAISYVQAQETKEPLTLTLDKALEIALSDNPTIKVAEEEIALKKVANKETWQSLLPEASIGGTWNHTITAAQMNLGGQSFKMGQDDSNTVSGTLNISLPLFAPSVYKAMSMTKTDIELAVEKSRASKQDLVNQVTKAYYQLMLAQDSYEVLQKSYKLAEDNYNVVNAKYQQGAVSEFDKISAEVQMRSVKPNVISAGNAVTLSKLQLKVLMGITEDFDLKIADNLANYETDLFANQLNELNEGLVNNTTMKQFDLNMKMLNQNLKSLKTNFMPTLGMNYSYQYQSLYNNNWNVFDYNWGGSSALVFTLNIPLYKASNFTKLKTARIQINQLKENRTDTERKLNMQITSYQNNMAASSEQVVSNKENVMQAQKAVEIAGKRYEVGKGTVLELNSSQVSLTQAELTYNQSIYDYLVSKADLDQVLGRDYSTNK